MFKKCFLKDSEFSVRDVQVHGGYIIHMGVADGAMQVGDTVDGIIDEVEWTVGRGSVVSNIFFFLDAHRTEGNE